MFHEAVHLVGFGSGPGFPGQNANVAQGPLKRHFFPKTPKNAENLAKSTQFWESDDACDSLYLNCSERHCAQHDVVRGIGSARPCLNRPAGHLRYRLQGGCNIIGSQSDALLDCERYSCERAPAQRVSCSPLSMSTEQAPGPYLNDAAPCEGGPCTSRKIVVCLAVPAIHLFRRRSARRSAFWQRPANWRPIASPVSAYCCQYRPAGMTLYNPAHARCRYLSFSGG